MRRLATAVAFLLLLRFGDPGAAPPREPLTLCIVVDVTASMAPMGAQVIGRGSAAGVVSPEESVAQVAAAVAAVSELLEPGDRVCVGRIARAVAFSPGLVPPGSVRQSLGVLEASDADRVGPSPVWDAADEALGLLEDEPGRRAVVLWTDGRASGNRQSRFSVARRARTLGIPISVVSPPTDDVIRQSETLAARIRPSVYLDWLARETGGEFRTARRSMAWPFGDVLPPLVEILEALRRDPRPGG